MGDQFKILLVDDDPVFLFLHEKLLRKVGIEVSIDKCSDGQQALAYIESDHEENVFCVLLDINMPVMNGWEFLRSIQRLPYNASINVFIVSSASRMVNATKKSSSPRLPAHSISHIDLGGLQICP
ncbi:response regulator [Dyadobacter sp.]|uniref:response regulator n=1 Tax=Dyadobacter sp. TaxID=1914288 RepID=UPI003F709E3D